MVGRTIRIGRLFGIKINVDWSWLLIFLLVAWNLTTAFGNVHPDWSLWLQIGTAVVAAVLFFGSVLAHEMAHSLMAVAQGIPVRSITLFLFGGVSNIEREPPSPRAEFLITIVGPLTSFVLGIIFVVISGVSMWPLGDTMDNPQQIMADLTPLTTLLLWLGPINMVLGIFNLVPGFPLDGGRILRSILWGFTGSLRQATRWASWVGQGIAWLLIVTGVAMAFGANVPFFGTGLISGLWLAFIGWFLNNASIQGYRQVVVQDLLEDIPVKQIMREDPPVVAPDNTINQLVHEGIMGTDDHAFPVVEEGQLVGIVCLHDIRGVAKERWQETTVREIMTRGEKLVTVGPEEEADQALNTLQRTRVRQLPVAQNGNLVGLLRRRDVMRWLQLQAEEDRLPGA